MREESFKPCGNRRGVGLTVLVAGLIVAAAGCGGDNLQFFPTPTPTAGPTGAPTATPTTSMSISGTAVQGPMTGSTITAFAVNSDGSSGKQLGSTTTDSKGAFTLTIGKTSDTLRFAASGGSYTSEMNGAAISSPATIFKVLLKPSPGESGISINPLTDFVNSQALAAAGSAPFNAAVNDAEKKVRSFYGLTAAPGKIVPDYTAAGVGTDAGNLGLILGAFINEDQYLCPGSPGGLVTALSSDISDGIFDGMAAGRPVPYCGGNLPAIAGTSIFQDALSGVQQIQLVTRAFAFGGAGNILTANGLADLATGGLIAYPLTPLSAINAAIPQAAPSPVNSFAPVSQTARLNARRLSATATLLPNGKVLIAGGTGPSSALASTELYDPTGNSFAKATPDMNVARNVAAAALLPNGKVLIAGGAGSFDISLASTELYEPTSNTFAPPGDTASMNTARKFATATLLPNGKVLIAGGFGSSGILASTELYDPTGNSFAKTTPDMNVARNGATAAPLPNGKVLIAGGFSRGGFLVSTELYDPATNSFATTAPSMNVAREFATATLLPNGKVLIAGGVGVSGDVLASTELYDPATNSFATTTPSMNAARQLATATLLPNGHVLIAGGSGVSGDAVASTELYDPATNSFATTTPSMNAARTEATATLLPNGKVLIAAGLGGCGGCGVLASTELYTP